LLERLAPDFSDSTALWLIPIAPNGS